MVIFIVVFSHKNLMVCENEKHPGGGVEGSRKGRAPHHITLRRHLPSAPGCPLLSAASPVSPAPLAASPPVSPPPLFRRLPPRGPCNHTPAMPVTKQELRQIRDMLSMNTMGNITESIQSFDQAEKERRFKAALVETVESFIAGQDGLLVGRSPRGWR